MHSQAEIGEEQIPREKAMRFKARFFEMVKATNSSLLAGARASIPSLESVRCLPTSSTINRDLSAAFGVENATVWETGGERGTNGTSSLNDGVAPRPDEATRGEDNDESAWFVAG